MGSRIDRKPGLYCQPVWKVRTLTREEYVEDGDYLRNTNETFHPVVRYRHGCKRQAKLGYDDKGSYGPENMNDWTWPQTQADGRIGVSPSTTSPDPLLWSRSKKGQGKLDCQESRMGKHERLYLAFYDQDKELRDRDGSIWKQILGGDGYVFQFVDGCGFLTFLESPIVHQNTSKTLSPK